MPALTSVTDTNSSRFNSAFQATAHRVTALGIFGARKVILNPVSYTEIAEKNRLHGNSSNKVDLFLAEQIENRYALTQDVLGHYDGHMQVWAKALSAAKAQIEDLKNSAAEFESVIEDPEGTAKSLKIDVQGKLRSIPKLIESIETNDIIELINKKEIPESQHYAPGPYDGDLKKLEETSKKLKNIDSNIATYTTRTEKYIAAMHTVNSNYKAFEAAVEHVMAFQKTSHFSPQTEQEAANAKADADKRFLQARKAYDAYIESLGSDEFKDARKFQEDIKAARAVIYSSSIIIREMTNKYPFLTNINDNESANSDHADLRGLFV